jgi:hypothetical protein
MGAPRGNQNAAGPHHGGGMQGGAMLKIGQAQAAHMHAKDSTSPRSA